MLKEKAPESGTGWGCFQCGLPQDGAVAVLCDDCFARVQAGETLEAVLLFACKGQPAKNERVLFSALSGWHRHDMSKHPEGNRNDPG